VEKNEQGRQIKTFTDDERSSGEEKGEREKGDLALATYTFHC